MDTIGVLMCLLLCFIVNIRASLISTKMDLCGTHLHLNLDQFDESAATIALVSYEDTFTCTMKIVAPSTHVIYLSIIDTISPDATIPSDLRTTSKTGSCHLHVYQKENPEPVWSGDPCSNEPLSDIDLLNPEVTLEWFPPQDPAHSKGKSLLVTAVGRGDVCKDTLQHTCMSIGHEPLFCVSKYLLCDGNHNCPKGATKDDEDDKLCKITWSVFFKQFKNPEVNDKILNLLLSKTTKAPKISPAWQNWSYVQKAEVTTLPATTEETQTNNMESISAALSHYGPWGYILLGMLICGTVLMFCGVWECFRKPKPAAETTQSSPTTVLIINQPDEGSPPRYDDIDPPSYSALFPNIKVTDTQQTIDSTSGTSETSTNQHSETIGTTENQSNNQSSSASTSAEDEVATASGVSDTNINVEITSDSSPRDTIV